jgi:high-affinity Fe2+/Pb2+ permease
MDRVDIFESFLCLYSLGITRIIIGISRHKPVGYLAILSLAVGLYFLWHFSRNKNNWNSLMKNIINAIAILSGIPLLVLTSQKCLKYSLGKNYGECDRLPLRESKLPVGCLFGT